MFKKPTVQSSKFIYRGFFDLRQDILEKGDGTTHSYTSLVLSTHATTILAQDKEGRWILNREYRHPIGGYILGTPGGRLEPGEDPIAGGQRELLEETGYWSDDVALMGSCFPLAGICDQKIYFLLVRNAVKIREQKLDPFEFIHTELKTDEELKAEMRSGAPIDGTLCAALWYKDSYLTTE